MKSVRLTRRAENRLAEIAAWTIKRFGPAQADRYERQLVHRLNALAVGDLPKGRPCGLLVPERVDAPDLLYVREGAHFIIYRETAEQIQVIDFVHGARDLEGILKDLGQSLD